MGKQFDELAKALASGVSRRSALKRFAAGMAGFALANVVTGRTAEAQVEERDCRTLCSSEFGLEGRELGQCVSQCAACRQHGGAFVSVNGAPAICV